MSGKLCVNCQNRKSHNWFWTCSSKLSYYAQNKKSKEKIAIAICEDTRALEVENNQDSKWSKSGWKIMEEAELRINLEIERAFVFHIQYCL
jgi:hypothetical protein